MNILMVAAENDGLTGGKVGGIGDVIRDIPPAVASRNNEVNVVVPSYGFLHTLPDSELIDSIDFPFGGSFQRAEIYRVPGKVAHPKVRHIVIDHPGFSSYDPVRGVYEIYCDDPPERPFARDASKYALFCTAVAEAVTRGTFGRLDCIHLHDWHMAFLLVLRQFHVTYQSLRKIRIVYTIHNLALQGIRPFRGSDSSLEAWYPNLWYDWSALADPRWHECINPMAAGIRLSDAVHTVSPSYAEEILYPSDRPRYYGGEGLEADLRAAKEEGRLHGILNGCVYPQERIPAKLDFKEMLSLFESELIRWAGAYEKIPSSLFVAYARLRALRSLSERPPVIITSVSRIVEQKMLLMRESGTNFKSGLHGVLESLRREGLYILLGDGDTQYERFLTKMSSQFENFLFLNGYSDECASCLYANGDLFLMPSSFEPCGMSQMLAMRDGQPCLVHEVGGLKDTVENGFNGFSSKGDTVINQVDNFIRSFSEAISLKRNDPDRWQQICRNAYASRFLWKDAVEKYIEQLYT
jgi:starch synthase